MNAAKYQGILLPINVDDFQVGNTNGNRTDLKASEVNRLIEYYRSSFIREDKKLILGYFLFSCFTGLRISEVISIHRSTRTLLAHCDRLFLDKKDPIYMNRELKKIVKTCGITKKVSFHVGRHTFATNFLRAGGDVVSLQSLLGHSNIRQTMIYVHIVESEVNEKVFIIDELFDS